MSARALQVWWSDRIRDTTLAAKDRLRASQLLAQAKGLFVERIEVRELPPLVVEVETV